MKLLSNARLAQDGKEVGPKILSRTWYSGTTLMVNPANESRQEIKQSAIQFCKQLNVSLMPEELYQQMGIQQLANLPAYHGSLKKKMPYPILKTSACYNNQWR